MSHPYRDTQPYAHWAKAMSAIPPAQVDPVVDFKFRLTKDDRVATAGSCFAQHISRHLAAAGFNYLVVEPGHPIGHPKVNQDFGYGVFSARYGNVYTSRQLVQLFDRAYDRFTPNDDVWFGRDGRPYDPFRPNVQPGGFASVAELRADRAQHLAAVRRMFESLDVFVFTLGLTELWSAADDGAAYPLAPGVAAGLYDPERHLFTNLRVDDVVADMEGFLARLAGVNSRARVILTVSPVPLIATAEPRHVLVSTTLSKSTLRVAADILERRHAHVAYFPSYEIVTGNHARGAYFADDLRSVTEDGVSHVMRLFMRHAAQSSDEQASTEGPALPEDRFVAEGRAIAEAFCDEELIKVATERSRAEHHGV